MDVTLFFGSFNPVHNGHLSLASYLVENHLCDTLWFVPSPQNPLKQNVRLWDDALRLDLLRKSAAAIDGVGVCDIEYSMPRPNYTYLTLRALRQKYPQHIFSLLIGGDNYEIFDKWRNYEEILSNHKVFVYPRTSGGDLDYDRFPQMVYLASAPLLPISSTLIRNYLSDNKDISEFVPESIVHIIEDYVGRE